MGGAAPIVMLIVFFAGMLFDSGQESQVILLPEADGSVGVVEVSSAGGRIVLSEAGQMTTVKGAAAPLPPVVLSEKAIEATFSTVLAIEPPQPQKFLLYFDQGTTQLVTDSERLLPQIYLEIEQRQSYAIGVYGHSDRTGSDAYNLQLSLSRAEVVRDLLIGQGVDLRYIDVDSHGEGNPVIPTADGVAEPRNRRVEVIVR